jgi:hypothetical protein
MRISIAHRQHPFPMPQSGRELSQTMPMSLSELMQARFDSAGTILATFSLFFTIVSAYIAALYFFLGKAPFAMRAVAFTLLSISFLFLAAVVASITEVVEVLITRWSEAAIPVGPNEWLRAAFMQLGSSYGLYYSGLVISTTIGIAVFIVLGYLTFFYSWPHLDSAQRN